MKNQYELFNIVCDESGRSLFVGNYFECLDWVADHSMEVFENGRDPLSVCEEVEHTGEHEGMYFEEGYVNDFED